VPYEQPNPLRRWASGLAFGRMSWTSNMLLLTAIAVFWNQKLGLLRGLTTGVLGYFVLRWLASYWSLVTPRRKTIRINVISGLVLGLIGGTQGGWGGGPDGSPVAVLFGVLVPFRLLTWPFVLALGFGIFGFLKGVAAYSAAQVELRQRKAESDPAQLSDLLTRVGQLHQAIIARADGARAGQLMDDLRGPVETLGYIGGSQAAKLVAEVLRDSVQSFPLLRVQDARALREVAVQALATIGEEAKPWIKIGVDYPHADVSAAFRRVRRLM
jgi:hypothetical protein